MKTFDSVVIACDQTTLDCAQALRASLELFRLHVTLHFCVQKRNVIDFVGGKIPDAQYVVLDCHGLGSSCSISADYPDEQPQDMKMGFYVVDEEDEFKSIPFALTPENIPNLVHLPGRTVLSIGCGSGREPLAKAFLESGCKEYIGPIAPVDQDSGTLFAISFFYHLLEQQRGVREQCSVKEAVQRTAGIDVDFEEGTKLFRYYTHEN